MPCPGRAAEGRAGMRWGVGRWAGGRQLARAALGSDRGLAIWRGALDSHRTRMCVPAGATGRRGCRCFSQASGEGVAGEARRVTLTTPLYYANASPHMGSAYPTIAADTLARYYRAKGDKVHFVTGTDEHGEKIAASASGRGLTPTEHVNAIADEFKSLWQDLGIQYDSFIRTTDAKHASIVEQVVRRVWDQGDIYKSRYQGFYCVGCEEYKAEADMIEGHVCPIHRTVCVERDEENYFFRLSKYQGALEELFASRPDFVRPMSRRNEVVGWVDEGLRDFSISRAGVDWGIDFPTDQSQTVYVWFDALLGYVSALLSQGEDIDEAEKKGWPASVHIIGKDILRFHAVYWPAMLMSAGLPLPGCVYGHGFLTKEGLKMGKSLGNVLEPKDLVARFGSDAVRYYFLKEITFGQDGDFEEGRFVNIVNANLANDVGNCLNRTLTLLKKNCGGIVPMDTATLPENHTIRAVTEENALLVGPAYEELDFGQACSCVLEISGRCNQFMEAEAPWALFKSGEEGDAARAREALSAILEAMRIVGILLSPVTPELSGKIREQLGLGGSEEGMWEDSIAWGFLKEGDQTNKPKPVFQRLEAKETQNVG